MNKSIAIIAIAALFLAGCAGLGGPAPTPTPSVYAGPGSPIAPGQSPIASEQPQVTPAATAIPTSPTAPTIAPADRYGALKVAMDSAIQVVLKKPVNAQYDQVSKAYAWADSDVFNGRIDLKQYPQNSYGSPSQNIIQIDGKTVDFTQTPSSCRKGDSLGCKQTIRMQCYNFAYMFTIDITEDTALNDPTYPSTLIVKQMVPHCPD
ncbi:MAG TPA: hypothetical protein VGQ00_04690 [Candidatus Norongarragalinales archaeon]|jgi:hypothetical protein|nr:hypothetical protein [Candidatus Norongarragalinales archaeon]